LLQRVGQEEQPLPEALVTRFTMKCPGYSTGGRVPEYSRP
jgi:hypothetical protein